MKKNLVVMGLLAAFGLCVAGCGAECKGDETKCENNTLYMCIDGEWASAKCPNSCSSDNLSCGGECTEGDTKCENNILFTCSEGEWLSAKCPNSCSADNKSCGN